MSAAEKCAKLECENRARWYPVLVLEPPGARAVLALGLCHEHKILSLPEDFITDEGWAHLMRPFEAAGRAVPERNRTQLEWLRVGEDPFSKAQIVADPREGWITKKREGN